VIGADAQGAAEGFGAEYERGKRLMEALQFAVVVGVGVVADREFFFVGVVAGIHADFFHVFDGFHRGAREEMDIGDERDVAEASGGELFADGAQALGGGDVGCGDADDLAADFGEGDGLSDGGGDVLGGPVRSKMRVYSWIGGDRPDDIVAGAKEVAARGFTAIKMLATEEMAWIDSNAKIDAVLERVGALREAMGPEFGIAVDFHGRLHRPMAKVLAKELDPYALMFIEEPVLSEHVEALREIANHTATPIALGERLFSRWDFKTVLTDGLVDIIQPDPSHAGGITETKKIAAMAEAYDVALALHCPLGPIALAACLQLDAVCVNAVIQEQSLGIHYNKTNDLLDYVTNPAVFAYADGFVTIPGGPGLGIEINEDAVARGAAQGHRWRQPVWRHEDGSFAEW